MSQFMLEKLEQDRAAALAFAEKTTEQAAERGGALSDAEVETLKQTRETVEKLDQQLKPLREFAALQRAADQTLAPFKVTSSKPSGDGEQRGGGAQTKPREYEYRSMGEVMADYGRIRHGIDQERATGRLASNGLEVTESGRLTRAVATQTTVDTPGLLPVKIIGQVDSDLDAQRPLMDSFGVKALGGIPGTKFQRPYLSQHVRVGKQTAEKTEVPSQSMKILSKDFTKETYGGVVNVSRQEIDWTSPAAWDALLADFLDVYAIETEKATATAFAAAVTQTQELTTAAAGTPTVPELIAGMYGAAAKVYAGGGRMPNHIWQDLTQWAAWGTALDSLTATAAGSYSTKVGEFVSAVLNLPRTVVPSWTAATTIVGDSRRYEVYEERIGFLTAVEPSIFGVELAYGGYLAQGVMRANAFAKIVNLA